MRIKSIFYSPPQQVEVKRLSFIQVSSYLSYSISLIFKQESFYKLVPLFTVFQITGFSNLLGNQCKLSIVLAYTTGWVVPALQHIGFQEFYRLNLSKVVTSLVVYSKPFYEFRLSTNNKLRQTSDLGPYLIVAVFRKSLVLLIVRNIMLDTQSLVLFNKL